MFRIAASRRFHRRCLGCCLLVLLSAAPSEASGPIDDLLAQYRALGLPLPPEDAVLAIRRPGWRSTSNGEEKIVYHLAFVEKPASRTERGYYWIGAERVAFGSKWETWQAAAASGETLEKTKSVPPHDEPDGFKTFPDLALAVQCKARGWDELAEALLARWRDPSPAERSFGRRKSRPHDDRKVLSLFAWNYWCNQFVDMDGDRPAIIKRLDELLDGPHGLDTQARRNIVADMKLTIADPPAETAPLAIAVERLLDLDFTGSS